MNATQARQLLLVRAAEEADTSAWTEVDRRWVSDEALRIEGEQASRERWLHRRAALAIPRIVQRNPALSALAKPGPSTLGLIAIPSVIAALFGLASNAVGPSERINLLAPPLLAVLVWNLVVYVLLAVHAVSTLGRRQPPAPTPQPGPSQPLRWLLERRWTPSTDGSANNAASRFIRSWAEASQGLQAARITTALHLAAAALAGGALAGLYLRGLAFEFRAGWDSTFLDADAVHTWLQLLLGPAAHASATPLPDAAQLDALRFSRGNGENAAHWIHLYAITTVALVLLPRIGLAVRSAVRAIRLKRDFPLSIDGPYFKRLLRSWAGSRQQAALRVTVLPYSHGLAAERQSALAHALADELGPSLSVEWRPNVSLGGEDSLDQHWPTWPTVDGEIPAAIVVLCALTATPERETHGAFIAAVSARCAGMRPPPRCLVAVDESGFKQRLAGSDLAPRLAQRREAWRAMLEPMSLRPLFVDLGSATP